MAQEGIVEHDMAPKRPSRVFGIKLIKVRFQFKFAFMVGTFLAISAGLIYFWGNMTVNRLLNSGMIVGEDAILSLHLLKDNILYISVLSLAITLFLSLFFSHFVAGPMYRFERTLETMRDGDLTTFVKLRKHDEFKEVADLFNQTIVSLREKVKTEREAVGMQIAKARQLVERLKAAGRTQEATELEQLLFEFHNTQPQIKI